MNEKQPDYLSYLLRLWRVNDSDTKPDGNDSVRCSTARQTTWRASLQSPHTRTCRGFASLDDLFAYLRQCIGDLLAEDK